MSEASPINITAFQPFEGGRGKRLSATTTSSRGVIPGTQAVSNPDRLRLLITNGGNVSAYIRMGQEDVEATTDCQEILPGTQVILTPPVVAPDPVWVAAICEGGTTKVQVTSGYGT